MPSSLFQVVNSLFQTCSKLFTTTWNKQCENNLLTACEQICNNLCVFTCVVCSSMRGAQAKISHLVASLSTSWSGQQVVFALLVTSCQQVWNKLLTICNNFVDIINIRLVTRLFQQVRYSHDITILLQPVSSILVYHDCIRLVRITLWQVW
jgi:hypothetical protein